MTDLATAMWSGIRDSEALGKLMRGLAVLAQTQSDLWLIVEGRDPRRFALADVGITLAGMSVGDELVVPFATVTACEKYSGEPCISFTTDGKDAIIAPAVPPQSDEFMKEVVALLRTDWYDTDTVYLCDLDGSVGARGIEGAEVQMRRPKATAEAFPELEGPHADDEMVVLGETMRLGDITWMERETDGDGNRYGHVVMSDGRYRRIAFGDLGR